jgi:hypothetical protein
VGAERGIGSDGGERREEEDHAGVALG